MKAIKRIIIWIVISLSMQIAVLYYLDNYLFASEGTSNNIVSTKIDDNGKKKNKDIDILIPEDAEGVSFSYDGTYLSYYEDDTLKVIDTYTGEENSIEVEDELKVSFYRWAPDRNIMLISAKKQYENSSKFLFYSYDAERNLNEKLETKEQDDTSLKTDKNAEVEEIQLSPLTNMIYIKTDLKGGRSSIHNINIMKRINEVDTEADFIGDIRILTNDDRIAYESISENKVYVTGEDEPIYIDDVDKMCLIDVDENDNIYIGELDEDSTAGSYKVKNIYYGTIDEDTSEWNKVSVPEGTDKKNIHISRDGKIYLNDNLRGIVKELISQKEVKYVGSFLQIYESGIASVSDGKLIDTPLE